MGRADPVMPEPAAPRRWLSIVGIGEDGVDGLSPIARGLIAGADIVFGGERHLELAALAHQRRGEAPGRVRSRARSGEVLASRGRQVCVLASGDPFFYGVGSVLAAPCLARRKCWWCRRRRPSASPRRASAGRCPISRWSRCMGARSIASARIFIPARACWR